MRISASALFAVSHILSVSNAQDEYKGCTTPSFEWATFATKTSARSKGLRGALSGGYLFSAGNIRSNFDADVNSEPGTMGLTGPFSVDDPTGTNANTIDVQLTSYPESSGWKENAGGSFGQYEIGVAKVNADTGEPKDIFVYGGFGMDELSGLAAKDDAIAVSGHFTGNLTAVMTDDSSKTIWNSNIEEGGVPDQADQFHPNSKDKAGHTGVDDGFVIKARADDGKADWIIRYPESNRDAMIVAVDMDAGGNIFGSGYKCTLAADAEAKVCNGLVSKMKSADGEVEWETMLPELGAAFHLRYDAEDEALYVQGTTTYGGSAADAKDHPVCDHDACAVTLRLSATDGSVHWQRTVKGSPQWGIVDQTGGIELASADDGPYIYVAYDDVGEGDDMDIPLDSGTHYAGCKDDSDGTIAHEFDVITSRVMVNSDCPTGSTYFSRTDDIAVPASQVNTGAQCGDSPKTDACVIKYHKYTGLPKWGLDTPSVAGLVPSSDGKSVHIAGYYSISRGDSFFDAVYPPGYLRTGGLGSQRGGMYNAKISAELGDGEYVMHSGGGSWDRLYDMVGDAEGNLYNIGFSGNIIMNWGGSLVTTVAEDGVDQGVVLPGTGGIERHMFISKLASATESTPSCLTTCSDSTDTAVISSDSCFIDGQCYTEGDTGGFFGKACWVCDPSQDQREWVQGPNIGTTQCYIDDLCLNTGDPFFYQRRSWSEKIFSDCQVCDPALDITEWSLKKDYTVDATVNPPDDCTAVKSGDGNGNGSGGGSGDGSGGGNGNGSGNGNGGGKDSVSGSDDAVNSHDSNDSHGSHSDDETKSGASGKVITRIAGLMYLMFVINM